MNKIIYSLFVFAYFLLGCQTLTCAAPKIVFEKEQLDFGSVVTGDPVKVSFNFKNTGDANLEIIGVYTSCGCAKCQPLEKTISPGKSSAIEVVFNSAGYTGLIAKKVEVQTNDPSRSTLTLRIIGRIDTVATILPPKMNFGTIKPGSTHTVTLEVIPSDPKSFVITKVESQGTRTSVRGFRKVEDKTGIRWIIEVVIKAGSETERICESILISAKAGSDVTLSALVFGNVANE